MERTEVTSCLSPILLFATSLLPGFDAISNAVNNSSFATRSSRRVAAGDSQERGQQGDREDERES